MVIAAGDQMPEGSFKLLGEDGLADLTAKELFAGKKVVLFAVPGAFTPTCMAKHLPSFLDNAAGIKEKGVDTIACMAANDPFVMDAWGNASGVNGEIMLLSDGDAAYAKALDLTFDGSMANLGIRSKRFAMIVEDGKVSWIAVENAPPSMDVSSGDDVLKAL